MQKKYFHSDGMYRDYAEESVLAEWELAQLELQRTDSSSTQLDNKHPVTRARLDSKKTIEENHKRKQGDRTRQDTAQYNYDAPKASSLTEARAYQAWEVENRWRKGRIDSLAQPSPLPNTQGSQQQRDFASYQQQDTSGRSWSLQEVNGQQRVVWQDARSDSVSDSWQYRTDEMAQIVFEDEQPNNI